MSISLVSRVESSRSISRTAAPVPHSRFSLCPTKGQFPGREFCRRFVEEEEDNILEGNKERASAKEGGARQENSENVGFHKGTITIVKEEGTSERERVGYLGGPTAKISPSVRSAALRIHNSSAVCVKKLGNEARRR